MAGAKDERRGLGLAGRFRAALDGQAAAHRRQEEEQARREAHARQERLALLADLAAFGRALGHAQVRADEERVEIRLGGRLLAFVAGPTQDAVLVEGEGLRPGWVIRLQPELERWGLYPPHGAARPLFDKGLEELLRRVFELRPAEGEDEPPPATAPDGEERSLDEGSPPRRSL